MAQLPTFRRIQKEDIPNSPAWFDTVISVVNQFFESTYRALANNLTFEQNFIAQIKTFNLTAGASASANTFNFAVTMSAKPQGLIPLKITQSASTYVPLTNASSIDWHYESSKVFIDAIHGLTNGESYEITVLII